MSLFRQFRSNLNHGKFSAERGALPGSPCSAQRARDQVSNGQTDLVEHFHGICESMDLGRVDESRTSSPCSLFWLIQKCLMGAPQVLVSVADKKHAPVEGNCRVATVARVAQSL